MSKKAQKQQTKNVKDSKSKVHIPFSQNFNSQDSLFLENEAPQNSQYGNNMFGKPSVHDSKQFPSNIASIDNQNMNNFSIFDNEWEISQKDIPITSKENINKKNEGKEQKKQAARVDSFKCGMNKSQEREDDENENMYEPEILLDKRVINGFVEYLVKWVEFPTEESTWEPAENIQACAFDLIQLFEDDKLQWKQKLNATSKSPILPPAYRKLDTSLPHHNDQTQATPINRSPMRKNQPTPNSKEALRQLEDSAKQNSKGPRSPLNKNSGQMQNNSKPAMFDPYQSRAEKQIAMKIQNDNDARVFDHQNQIQFVQNKVDLKNSKKDQNTATNNQRNNKLGGNQESFDNNFDSSYLNKDQARFEQKNMAGRQNLNQQSKQPILMTQKDTHFYDKLKLNNAATTISPILSPHQNDASPYHTPVNKNVRGDKKDNQINAQTVPLINQNAGMQQKEKEMSYSPINFTDNKKQIDIPSAKNQRGKATQNILANLQLSSSTPDIATGKAIKQPINRDDLYKEIEISHNLLKSPMNQNNSKTNTHPSRANQVPQSPPIIFNNNGQPINNQITKSHLKRIEISDDESGIENVDNLDEIDQSLIDDIIPAFAEYQRINQRKNPQQNKQTLNNKSSTITPQKQQGNITPNSSKSPNLRRQDYTPVNKMRDLTPIRDVLRNQKGYIQEEDGIRTPVRNTNQATTPLNKSKEVSSIWSYQKKSTQQLQNDLQNITPIKKIDYSKYSTNDSKTPTRNDNKTPIRSDNKTPLRNDSKTPIRVESKTPVRNDGKTPVRNETKTPNRNDPKTPIRNDIKTPLRNSTKSPIGKKEKTPINKIIVDVEENPKPRRGRPTAEKESTITPQRADLSTNRKSNKMIAEPTPQQQEENLRMKKLEQERIQNLKEQYQVHLKLRESRILLQSQTDQIHTALQTAQVTLQQLTEVSYTAQPVPELQQEQEEDLVTRIKKKFENILNQQQKDNNKSPKEETPNKIAPQSPERIVISDNKKTTKQGSNTKKNQKVDPKAGKKKSATKEPEKMEIESDTEEKQTSPQKQPQKPSSKKAETNKSENPSKQTKQQEISNTIKEETQTPMKRRGRKEQKIEEKQKEKQEKITAQKDQTKIEQDTESQTELKKQDASVSPFPEKKRSARISLRQANQKQESPQPPAKTPIKEEKSEIVPPFVEEQKPNTSVMKRRSQAHNQTPEKQEQVIEKGKVLPSPDKAKSIQKASKAEPVVRSTRSSARINQKDKTSLSNTPIKETTNAQQEIKQNEQKDNKKNQKQQNQIQEENIQKESDKNDAIVKILNLVSQKKQKRGQKSTKQNNEFPSFEVELSNGKTQVIPYTILIESHPKKIAEFLIQDFM